MLTLRLLAIIGLFALSTIPFAIAGNDNEDPHHVSGESQGEGAEGAEIVEGLEEGPGVEGEEEPID